MTNEGMALLVADVRVLAHDANLRKQVRGHEHAPQKPLFGARTACRNLGLKGGHKCLEPGTAYGVNLAVRESLRISQGGEERLFPCLPYKKPPLSLKSDRASLFV